MPWCLDALVPKGLDAFGEELAMQFYAQLPGNKAWSAHPDLIPTGMGTLLPRGAEKKGLKPWRIIDSQLYKGATDAAGVFHRFGGGLDLTVDGIRERTATIPDGTAVILGLESIYEPEYAQGPGRDGSFVKAVPRAPVLHRSQYSPWTNTIALADPVRVNADRALIAEIVAAFKAARPGLKAVLDSAPIWGPLYVGLLKSRSKAAYDVHAPAIEEAAREFGRWAASIGVEGLAPDFWYTSKPISKDVREAINPKAPLREPITDQENFRGHCMMWLDLVRWCREIMPKGSYVAAFFGPGDRFQNSFDAVPTRIEAARLAILRGHGRDSQAVDGIYLWTDGNDPWPPEPLAWWLLQAEAEASRRAAGMEPTAVGPARGTDLVR
jgi:hypothetical protein